MRLLLSIILTHDFWLLEVIVGLESFLSLTAVSLTEILSFTAHNSSSSSLFFDTSLMLISTLWLPLSFLQVKELSESWVRTVAVSTVSVPLCRCVGGGVLGGCDVCGWVGEHRAELPGERDGERITLGFCLPPGDDGLRRHGMWAEWTGDNEGGDVMILMHNGILCSCGEAVSSRITWLRTGVIGSRGGDVSSRIAWLRTRTFNFELFYKKKKKQLTIACYTDIYSKKFRLITVFNSRA